MGRQAEIRGVDYFYGGPKGIIIFITISEYSDLFDCLLESPEGRIYLDIPTDITNNWFHTSMSWEEWSDVWAEEREMRAEEEEIMAEERIGEMEMLEEMQMDAEMR
jgi:hypothetical protein